MEEVSTTEDGSARRLSGLPSDDDGLSWLSGLSGRAALLRVPVDFGWCARETMEGEEGANANAMEEAVVERTIVEAVENFILMQGFFNC